MACARRCTRRTAASAPVDTLSPPTASSTAARAAWSACPTSVAARNIVGAVFSVSAAGSRFSGSASASSIASVSRVSAACVTDSDPALATTIVRPGPDVHDAQLAVARHVVEPGIGPRVGEHRQPVADQQSDAIGHRFLLRRATVPCCDYAWICIWLWPDARADVDRADG